MTINFSDFTSTRHEVVAGEAPTQVPRLTRQLAKGAITDGQPILDTTDGNETISLPGPVISSIAEPESVVSISTSSNRTLDISTLGRNEEVHVVFDHSVGNSSGVLKLVKIDEAALQVPFYRDIGTGNTSLSTGAFSSNIVQSGLGGQTTYTITAGTNTFTKNALIGDFAVGDILLINPPTDLTTLSNNKSAVVTQVESTKVTVDRIFESTLTNVAIKKVTFRPEVNKDASLGIIRTDSGGAYSFESFCTSRSNVFGDGTPVDNLIGGPADTNSGNGLANARFSGNVGIGTSSPATTLHVVGTVTADTHFTSSDSNATLSTSGNGGTVRLRPNGINTTTGQLTVQSTGRVGIGTDIPDSQLHINDAANGNDHQIMFSYQDTNSHSIGRDHATGKFEFTSLTNNNGFNFIGAGPNANNNVFAVNTTQLMVNGDTGEVGIGTSSPDALLHISATSPHVDIGPQGGNRGKIGYHDLDVYIGSTSSTGEIHFKNNISSTDAPQSSGDTKMVITDSGVGIGTDTTSNQLHIKSDGSDANGATLRLHHANNNTSDHCATIILANNVGQFAAISGGTSGGNQNGFIAFSTDNAGTNTTKLTIAHDGTFTYPQATSFAVTGDLTIDSSGDINLDADGGDIILKDAGNTFGLLSNDNFTLKIQNHASDCDIQFIGNDSDGGGLITALSLDMSEAGAATFNNNVTAFSDRRLKDNIKTLDATKTYSMRGVSYTRNGRPGSGVIAQELEEVAPELVLTNDKGIKSVDYGRTIGYLIETIKDLNGRLTKTELLLEEALKHNKNNP